MEKGKSGLGRKIFDYCVFGSGIGAITEGAVRMANNPPKHIFNIYNMDNWQYQTSAALLIGGGAMLAYGLERLIKYCQEIK